MDMAPLSKDQPKKEENFQNVVAEANFSSPSRSSSIRPETEQLRHLELSSRRLASQKEVWKLEQCVVASLVRCEPDPPVDTFTAAAAAVVENPLFQVVPDDHQDMYSFAKSRQLYGGVDVSFPNSEEDMEAVAVYVIVDRSTMEVIYRSHMFFRLDVPYISGFLAFREILPLERLVEQQVSRRPEVTPLSILVDGNGILHPRHAGIACFLGTRTDIPTIGIGKSLIYEGGWTRDLLDQTLNTFISKLHQTIGGDPDMATKLSHSRGTILQKPEAQTVGPSEGDQTMMDVDQRNVFDRKQALQDLVPHCTAIGIPLVNDRSRRRIDDETDPNRFPVLGYAMVGHGSRIAMSEKSKAEVGATKPIFISVGHNISLQKAVQVTSSLSLYRIPEPVRQADLYGRELIRLRRAAQESQNVDYTYTT